MPVVLVILFVVLAVVAYRFPVSENLANWIVLLPMGTLFLGTVAWIIAASVDESFKSLRGFAMMMAVSAIPVAVLVQLVNPKKKA
ncbi:MAG: hypothetical protein U0165_12335 [Polyangiaceae bacterium]